MRLILTEAEKKAATWAELDDASLGKFVKAMMFHTKLASDEQGKILLMSAANHRSVLRSYQELR